MCLPSNKVIPDGITQHMTLTFVNAVHTDGTDLLVDFSDGTSATYTADELAVLRPERELWDYDED